MIFTAVTYLYIVAASVWSVLLVSVIRLYRVIISIFDRLRRYTSRCFRQSVEWLHAFTKWPTKSESVAPQSNCIHALPLETIGVVQNDAQPDDPLPAVDQVDLVFQ
jgi:hypothetical protein